MPSSRLFAILTIYPLLASAGAFNVVRDYSGPTFFNGWDFYGSWDNLTLGNATWVNQSVAMANAGALAYVNQAGHAIIKVDNTTNVPQGTMRNSVRITTQDYYDYGSLWIIDALHIPYGCSVWPAFWTKGPTWPDDGEIDIIESINLNPNNQMALHTTEGCLHSSSVAQTGSSVELDCSTGPGCVVVETEPNSYASGFAAAGGGVWATQFDVTGIYIWFWSRPNVPPSITQATSTSSIDISQWGTPSAAYPANPQCNLTSFFTAQQLVLDITLCGDWAGVPSIYGPQCGNAGPTGQCYLDNVVGPGSPKYDNAYFEISYVRAYSVLAPAAAATPGAPADAASPTANATPDTPATTTDYPFTGSTSRAKTSGVLGSTVNFAVLTSTSTSIILLLLTGF